ncbi:MAG: prepilin-type N-terminal cleavage/methylation domain-containing protein [Chitinivibrionales bacterium]|nr:prepilin-type N-terminal cleavage/methylation domain-containing protein [Chitinivibrionales bacterium]
MRLYQFNTEVAMGVARKNCEGFTLLEVLLGLFILVISLGTFLSMNTTISKTKADQDNINIAVTLAQEGIEAYRSVGHDQANCTSETDYGGIALYPMFKRRVVVSDAGGSGPAMKRIVVTIFWRVNGFEKRYILETMI